MNVASNSLKVQANRDYLEMTLILSRLDKAERLLNVLHDGHELSEREERLAQVVFTDWENCRAKLEDLRLRLATNAAK